MRKASNADPQVDTSKLPLKIPSMLLSRLGSSSTSRTRYFELMAPTPTDRRRIPETERAPDLPGGRCRFEHLGGMLLLFSEGSHAMKLRLAPAAALLVIW